MKLNPNFVQFCKDNTIFAVIVTVILILRGFVPPEQALYKTLLNSLQISFYAGAVMKVITGNARDLLPFRK